MNSYKFIISGKVQGVWYRKFVSRALMRMQLQGYVQNLSDGTVEVIARIFDDQYEAMLDVLREGSPLSSVDDITITELDEDDILYDGFEIR